MSKKNEKISKSMEGNNNAEKWTIDIAKKFFEDSIEKAKEKDDDENPKYDFIGEVAVSMDEYKEIYNYLASKYPELRSLRNKLLSLCESNCFYNAKRGKIVPSLGIINLKSNHGWTDRVDNTTQGEKTNNEKVVISFKKEKKK